MPYATTKVGIALAIAFIAGVAASPLVQHVVSPAHAEAPPLAPQVIDLGALKHGDLPKPGTMLIIPKGTAHAGAMLSNGPVKALAIKIPPQGPDDTKFVD